MAEAPSGLWEPAAQHAPAPLPVTTPSCNLATAFSTCHDLSWDSDDEHTLYLSDEEDDVLQSSPAPASGPSVLPAPAPPVPVPAPYIKKNIPWHPPTVDEARAALQDLRDVVRSPRPPKSKGRSACELDDWTREHHEGIMTFLTHYTNPRGEFYNKWTKAARVTATGLGRGQRWHETLRKETRAYIADRDELRTNPYGLMNCSALALRPELQKELTEYILSRGKYVQAADVQRYMARQDVKDRYGTKDISLSTAREWMRELLFAWRRHHKGGYKDGHERPDVKADLLGHFLPTWYSREPAMRIWDLQTGLQRPRFGPWPLDYVPPRPLVAWFHDESTFAQHDRRQSQWVHKDASPALQPKGEGASTMVADFVSADYGWLRSQDRSKGTRVLLKVGKNREGYFQNEDVLAHAHAAMNILQDDHPDEDHLLVFDNATTHKKRAPDALSARKMPKGTPKDGNNWGVDVVVRDEHGQIVHGTDGKPKPFSIRRLYGWGQDWYPVGKDVIVR